MVWVFSTQSLSGSLGLKVSYVVSEFFGVLSNGKKKKKKNGIFSSFLLGWILDNIPKRNCYIYIYIYILN